MQIALNIGQFKEFYSDQHFKKEVIELINKYQLFDINTYMSSDNYNKFIFTDADLLKLEKILKKLNKNPPLLQTGGNINKYSRKYRIIY